MPSFIKKHKNKLIFGALFAVVLVLVPWREVYAQGTAVNWLADKAVAAVGSIVQLYVKVVGQLCLKVVEAILVVANYNSFVTSAAVEQGWSVVRDVVNMFFIVILLVIAFATIFNVSEYKYQKMLPRLLIMAVVINFSRTICGLMIDFGQVVMLTFVNGFRDAAGGNFINALRINELLKFDPSSIEAKGADIKMVFGAFILAAILITITLVVLVAMAIILVMRIIALWFLIVLSPMAFLASTWPSGRISKSYGQWWDMFLDNIMIGPILAFFLWLSLLVLGSGEIGGSMVTDSGYRPAGESVQELAVGGSKVGTLDNIVSYMMGIGMLIMSLTMAMRMGGAAGAGVAGTALSKVKAWGSAAVRKPVSATKWAGRKVSERAGYSARAGGIEILSKAATVPVIGGLARRVVGGMRQKQQAESAKYTKYLSGLTKEEVAAESKKLSIMPQTAVAQARRQTIETRRLSEIRTMPFTSENKEEVRKRIAFLESRKGFDPDIAKNIKEIQAVRPDLTLSGDKLKEFAESLDPKEALRVSDKAFANTEFVGYLDEAVKKNIKEHGSKMQKDALRKAEEGISGQFMGATERDKMSPHQLPAEELSAMLEDTERTDQYRDEEIAKFSPEAQTKEVLESLSEAGRIDPLVRAGTLNLENADLKINSGELAKKIAEGVNDALRQQVRTEKRMDYAEGLKESMKGPGDHSAARGELLKMGMDLGSIYKYDKKLAAFENEDEAENFSADIKKNPAAIPKLSWQLEGEAQTAVLKDLKVEDFVKYARRAKTMEDRVDLGELLRKFAEFSKSDEADEGVKQTAKNLEGISVLRGFMKKTKEEKKSYSDEGIEPVLPEEEKEPPKGDGGPAGTV